MAVPVDLTHPMVAELLGRCTFGPQPDVACAVSGGADSLALLVLAAASGRTVTAIHVDHGLRDGSAHEVDLVARVAVAVGATVRSETVVVEPGPNLEARARAARYEVLPADVATGHTADDRAETFLLNLLRGSGPAGLASIRRGPSHPLLDLRRGETVGLCELLGIEPFEDPSNLDPSFRRNRVRRELLPLLADIGDRDPVPVLVRQADLFAELDDDVDGRASAVDVTSARALREAPVGVAGAAIRAWLLAAGVGGGYGLDSAAVARVLQVAHQERVATEITGGWRVSRTHDTLRVEPPT